MPLSTPQKIRICDLARKAFAAAPERAALLAQHGSESRALAAWRHDQQERVTGVGSLRHIAPEDYERLAEHFHRARMVYLQDVAIEREAVA